MKIQIDTESKIIRIEESVNIYEFFQMVKKLFPNDMWKEFKLETQIINNWSNPIIIKEYPVYPLAPSTPYPVQPYPYWITCQTGIHAENGTASNRTTYELKSGVFNIDCQVQN